MQQTDASYRLPAGIEETNLKPAEKRLRSLADDPHNNHHYYDRSILGRFVLCSEQLVAVRPLHRF
jgi:hypothetical protein